MAYIFYLGELQLPVPPAKLQMGINGQNKQTVLLSGMEINMVKPAKLTDISFEALLPQTPYPFAIYPDGFRDAYYYLTEIRKLKTEEKPFRLKIIRRMPEGVLLFDTDMAVTLESYKIKEDSKNGFDIVVSLDLKQYVDYGTKKLVPEADGESVSVETQRETKNAPAPTSPAPYTVQAGDTLWHIARKKYGDGELYPKIQAANPEITDANRIYPGQILILPEV